MTGPSSRTPRAQVSPASERFDASYYRTYYGVRPVHTAVQIKALAHSVVGLAKWWAIPVRTALEVGAGPGYWRDALSVQSPKIRVTSTDISPYACQRFGHEERDIARWSPSRPFDLVICQGVLQYLSAKEAEQAIIHLAQATRSLLFLEVPTTADCVGVLDHGRSDLGANWRTKRWYSQRLDPSFRQLGAGLWVKRSAGVAFYELEALR